MTQATPLGRPGNSIRSGGCLRPAGLLILACWAAAGARAQDGGARPARTQADVRYGGDERWHRLNLHLPEGDAPAVPLVVWIHGGAWVSGDKDDPSPALRLVDRGYAVASIEYRPATVAAWPAQYEDCRLAVRYLRANAGKLGIDPSRIGVWGPSAGGHLAAMLGVRSAGARDESRVQAVCDWFGPADLVNAISDAPPDCPLDTAETLWKLFLGPASGNQALRRSLTPERRRRLLASGSPIEYVSGDEPPFLIMHGDADRTVAPIQSRRFAERLKARRVDVTFQVIPGAGHRLGDRDACIEKAMDFFDRTIGGADAQARPIRLEAEAARLSGVARVVDHPAASGGRYVGYIDTPESGLDFDATVPRAGPWLLRLRFATGPKSENQAIHKVTVNGAEPVEVNYPTTGWDNWRDQEVPITLRAGSNRIRVANGRRFATLDRIELVPAPSAAGGPPRGPQPGAPPARDGQPGSARGEYHRVAPYLSMDYDAIPPIRRRRVGGNEVPALADDPALRQAMALRRLATVAAVASQKQLTGAPLTDAQRAIVETLSQTLGGPGVRADEDWKKTGKALTDFARKTLEWGWEPNRENTEAFLKAYLQATYAQAKREVAAEDLFRLSRTLELLAWEQAGPHLPDGDGPSAGGAAVRARVVWSTRERRDGALHLANASGADLHRVTLRLQTRLSLGLAGPLGNYWIYAGEWKTGTELVLDKTLVSRLMRGAALAPTPDALEIRLWSDERDQGPVRYQVRAPQPTPLGDGRLALELPPS